MEETPPGRFTRPTGSSRRRLAAVQVFYCPQATADVVRERRYRNRRIPLSPFKAADSQNQDFSGICERPSGLPANFIQPGALKFTHFTDGPKQPIGLKILRPGFTIEDQQIINMTTTEFRRHLASKIR